MSLVYVFCADGFEEVEGLTAVDLLRRAGCDVKTVSIMETRRVRGAHDITIETDLLLSDATDDAQMYVLPGGMPGTTHLKECEPLRELLAHKYEEKKWLAAICAAPSVLEDLGLLQGRAATSYPGCLSGEGVDCREDAVVVDGHIVTSRGVGTAIEFALALITALKGREEAERVAASILYH